MLSCMVAVSFYFDRQRVSKRLDVVTISVYKILHTKLSLIYRSSVTFDGIDNIIHSAVNIIHKSRAIKIALGYSPFSAYSLKSLLLNAKTYFCYCEKQMKSQHRKGRTKYRKYVTNKFEETIIVNDT